MTKLSSRTARKPQVYEDATNSRDKLIDAAKKVFAEKGFDGATVKDLADASGMNVSLVSYYFGGKEGLYKACIEKFSRENVLAAAKRILKKPESLEDFRVRLKLFAEEFIESHVREPEIATILHRECVSNLAGIKDIFREVILEVVLQFKDFCSSAKRSGFVRNDADTHISTILFFGGMIHALRIDPVHEEFFGMSIRESHYRERVIEQMVQTFIQGVQRKDNS